MATSTITRVIGQSGCRYLIERILEEKPGPLRHVYLASAGHQKYVLKCVSEKDFKYFQSMSSDLQTSPNVRVADDAIPEQSMFAYNYFKDHLLSFAQKDIPLKLVKRVLKDSLKGIAALHEKDVVHTEIKADNTLINWSETDGNTTIHQVQIADIEDAAYVPPDSAIVGRQCIYALTKRVIFAVTDEELKEGEERLAIVLERQLSYFSDLERLGGLLQYLGDSPWVQIFTVIAEGVDKKHPRAPFALWKDVDPEFKDLVGKMTSGDPRRRITAHEALSHQWFADLV